jgi:hypothetical protein
MNFKYNDFVDDAVYLVNNNYYDLLFKTKRMFFEMLKEHKPYTEFVEETNKIWNNVDHKYMQDMINKYEKMIESGNIIDKEVINEDAEFIEVFELTKEKRFNEVEIKYKKAVDNYYKGRLKTINKDWVDDNTYLNKLIQTYDDVQATIPYRYSNGKIASYHNIADYCSMLFNVNLVRAGWNQTLYDSALLQNDLLYLPPHPFACEECMMYQGKVFSARGLTPGYPLQEEAIEGGVGHPNCKHSWVLYWGEDQLVNNNYNSEIWKDQYQIKQKIRALDLEKKKENNNLKIFKSLNNYEGVDKSKAKIKAYNSKIRELKDMQIKL